jgi:hypothetical protein
MKVKSFDYKQFLINSQINYSCDYMTQFTDFSGDGVERFLKHSKLKPSFVWEQVKDEIIFSEAGSLIIDKTVLEHKNTSKIDCAYKQWSGSSHSIVMGIGLINLIYYNPELDRFWVIDFRIWDKKVDGKKETEHALELVKLAVKRIGLESFNSVLFDSFYASKKMLNYIGLDLKKIFITNLTSTRSLKESLQETGYKQVQDLDWTDQELLDGKNIYLRDIPKKMPIKLFSIASNDRRIDNIATNNLELVSDDDSTAVFKVQEENAKRWKVEEFHRQIKQTLGIAKCQCRKNRSQRNHILCCMLSWVYLTKQAIKEKLTIYQIKKKQLDNYMSEIMKHPYWKYEGV